MQLQIYYIHQKTIFQKLKPKRSDCFFSAHPCNVLNEPVLSAKIVELKSKKGVKKYRLAVHILVSAVCHILHHAPSYSAPMILAVFY